ncbi:amino acid permease [Capsulimonas corticalis]|uniref:Amino acid permease n=1 Tax=Capsulimonas corticalis TaxID=2219043 RepID=A0A402D004_9BACT|nr:APC family permease [Capsulimonas corticalis]BDI33787.1 amino acid permease [Capsulimonas corticalis]
MPSSLSSIPPPGDDSPELPPPPKYHSAVGGIRQLIFGRSLPTSGAGHQRLPKYLALPIFSSDALSSNAYATEAILWVLLQLGSGQLGALPYALPISVGICLLLFVVVLSYQQIIQAYPDGGGAYPVSRDNLGVLAALVAGASLLVDYVLTVAVSVAAGVAAVITILPAMHTHLVGICLFTIFLITIANLRGVRETGGVFAIPTYVFVFSIIATIIAGVFAIATHQPYAHKVLAQGHLVNGQLVPFQTVGIYLLLRAFSQGCTALTGVEAISNTVPLFEKPQEKNAIATMRIMALLAVVMFFGLTYVAQQFGISAMDQHDPHYRSVVGMVADAAWPSSLHWMFGVVQWSTALVLALAANTAFAGFPQLASMLARDNYLPRQLANFGDRLAFSNGIIILAVAAAALIYLFKGIVDDLLALYAIGVFTSFTLAQVGMVLRWIRLRTPGWQLSLFFNALGALATGAVTIIIGVSKFADGAIISSHFHFGPYYPHYGAWLVIVLVPIMVLTFYKINRHYEMLKQELALDNFKPVIPSRNVVLVLVPRLHRGIVEAIAYARVVSEDARAVYIETSPENTKRLKEEWDQWSGGMPLVIIESPYRSLIGPMLRYIEAVQSERTDDVVTVVVPELVTRKWWHRILHNQAGPLLRFALSSRRDVIVTSVRYFLEQ